MGFLRKELIKCLCFSLRVPGCHRLIAASVGLLISSIAHQSSNEGSPHRAEWCHAPAMRDTAPAPDADSLPPRSAGASQSTGSQERSADMQHRAPLSAAGWTSCPQWGWGDTTTDQVSHNKLSTLDHLNRLRYCICDKRFESKPVSPTGMCVVIDMHLKVSCSCLTKRLPAKALTAHTAVVLAWRSSPLYWREMSHHPCGNGTAVWHPWRLASCHRLREDSTLFQIRLQISEGQICLDCPFPSYRDEWCHGPWGAGWDGQLLSDLEPPYGSQASL